MYQDSSFPHVSWLFQTLTFVNAMEIATCVAGVIVNVLLSLVVSILACQARQVGGTGRKEGQTVLVVKVVLLVLFLFPLVSVTSLAFAQRFSGTLEVSLSLTAERNGLLTVRACPYLRAKGLVFEVRGLPTAVSLRLNRRKRRGALQDVFGATEINSAHRDQLLSFVWVSIPRLLPMTDAVGLSK